MNRHSAHHAKRNNMKRLKCYGNPEQKGGFKNFKLDLPPTETGHIFLSVACRLSTSFSLSIFCTPRRYLDGYRAYVASPWAIVIPSIKINIRFNITRKSTADTAATEKIRQEAIAIVPDK